MNKERILEKSRAENKNADLYEMELCNHSYRLAMLVTLIFVSVFLFVQLFAYDTINYGLFAILFIHFMTTHWVRAVKLKSRFSLVIAIVFTLCEIALAATYICGLVSARAAL